RAGTGGPRPLVVAATPPRARRERRAGGAVRHQRQQRGRHRRLCSRPQPGAGETRQLRADPLRAARTAPPADGAPEEREPRGGTLLFLYTGAGRPGDPWPLRLRGSDGTLMDWTALGISVRLGLATVLVLLPIAFLLGRALAFGQF